MVTIGIDPGITGAIAVLEGESLRLFDIPKWAGTVGGSRRELADYDSLDKVFHALGGLGADRVCLELVGGRPQQSAPAAFTFGALYGYLHARCLGLPNTKFLAVTPQKWKKALKVPGKTGTSYAADILRVADGRFPEYRSEWRGSRGGALVDRAEAALLALYAREFM